MLLTPVGFRVKPSEIVRLLAMNAREDPPSLESAEEWLVNPANFALQEGDDLSMFSAKGDWPGPLHAHIFFKSRGRKAEEIALRMLAQAFSYGATHIIGETTYRDVALFARRIGFKFLREEQRPHGKYYILRLSHNPLPMKSVA